MEGERTPRFPADTRNAMELISFVGNIKEREKWLTRANDVVARNEKLIETIGNADEIDKLHAEAKALRDSVLSEIEKREAALVADRENLVRAGVKQRDELAEEQRVSGELVQTANQDARQALAAAKASASASASALVEARKAQVDADKDRDTVATLRAELTGIRDNAKALADKLSG